MSIRTHEDMAAFETEFARRFATKYFMGQRQGQVHSVFVRGMPDVISSLGNLNREMKR